MRTVSPFLTGTDLVSYLVLSSLFKWQLIIFDAVVRSKLMYGLETAALAEALKTKMTPSRGEDYDKF